MSESAGGRGEIWIEKYRPESLDEVVGHPEITDRLKSYVEQNDLPNLLFAGPAGTGKCVTGETPVLTNEGVQRIEDVVGDIDGVERPEPELKIASLDSDGQVRFVEPSHVYSRKTEEVVSVKTRDGGKFDVTPEHPLLVITREGLEWKQAEYLSEGDRIARPLDLPTPSRETQLNWIDSVDAKRVFLTLNESLSGELAIPVEQNQVGMKRIVLNHLRKGYSIDEIVRETGISRNTVRAYEREVRDTDLDRTEQTCSLAYLLELDVEQSTLIEGTESICYVSLSNNKRSEAITPPDTLSTELATFVGLAVSEARIDGGRIQFYNTDESLLHRFQTIAEEVFGVETTRSKHKGVPYIEIGSKTLTHFLESCFDVFAGATVSKGIGSTIISADASVRAAFLRAVFDAEAYVDQRCQIELTQKNERLITLLMYLLGSFGIRSRRKKEKKAATNGTGIERTYHTLRISGTADIQQFKEKIGFSLEQKAERIRGVSAREGNPNFDTIPSQDAVSSLCRSLYLPVAELTTDSLNPTSPGRTNYLEDLNRVRSAAFKRLEAAQDARVRIEQAKAAGIQTTVSLPIAWSDSRAKLSPIEVRRKVSQTTGIRSDYLLEYADGRRIPTAERAGSLLVELNNDDRVDAIPELRNELLDIIESLGVPYNHLAENTRYYGTDFINLLKNDGHDVRSLSRFLPLADQIEETASNMLTEEILSKLLSLEQVIDADVHYDVVENTEQRAEETRVYDLTLPRTHNYIAGNIPTVMHNTASAVSIARHIYGENWRENFLELNASDERGIDVVRERIKNFARSSFGGHDYRIIFLDEADSLTSDAQAALRRTMEQYSHNTRFILSCNYSSQIIDPIQSRCAVFRFSSLPDDAVARRIREIADAEDIEITDDGVEALVYAANGDMRRAINALQAAVGTDDVVDEEAVFTITATARPEEIEAMVTSALAGEFGAARSTLDELLDETGLAGGDIIDQLHRSVWNFDLDDRAAVRLLDRIGEADYRIAEGANERIQLEALLAAVAQQDRK